MDAQLVSCYTPYGGGLRDVARIARTSFGNTDKEYSLEQDLRLVRYLWNHNHMTPFEFVKTTWRIEAPVFTLRQFMRHRTFAYNEVSARYIDLDQGVEDMIWRHAPEGSVKQGSGEDMDDENQVRELDRIYFESTRASRETYEKLIEKGVAMEQARAVLPLGTISTVMVSADLRNLMHFLDLRLGHGAQSEIKDIATAMMCELLLELDGLEMLFDA